MVNDLKIADACGAAVVVVHFGNLNTVLQQWDGENRAGRAGSLGVTMEELVQVRNLTDFPEHIDFCLDTCHAFASSGLWNGEEIVEHGEKLEYFKHLNAIHLNNSK